MSVKRYQELKAALARAALYHLLNELMLDSIRIVYLNKEPALTNKAANASCILPDGFEFFFDSLLNLFKSLKDTIN